MLLSKLLKGGCIGDYGGEEFLKGILGVQTIAHKVLKLEVFWVWGRTQGILGRLMFPIFGC